MGLVDLSSIPGRTAARALADRQSTQVLEPSSSTDSPTPCSKKPRASSGSAPPQRASLRRGQFRPHPWAAASLALNRIDRRSAQAPAPALARRPAPGAQRKLLAGDRPPNPSRETAGVCRVGVLKALRRGPLRQRRPRPQRSAAAEVSCSIPRSARKPMDQKLRRDIWRGAGQLAARAVLFERRAPSSDRRRRYGDACRQAAGPRCAHVCRAARGRRPALPGPCRDRPRRAGTRAQRRPDRPRRFLRQRARTAARTLLRGATRFNPHPRIVCSRCA